MGLALGDDVTGIASPLKIVPYKGAVRAAGCIAEIAGQHGAEVVVIGLPVNEDGERTPACARSEAIGRALEELAIEIAFQGEFLTTNEARRRAAESGLPGSKPVDHIAAQVLLEEFLADRVG